MADAVPGERVSFVFEIRDASGNLYDSAWPLTTELTRNSNGGLFEAAPEGLEEYNRGAGYYEVAYTLAADSNNLVYHLCVKPPAGLDGVRHERSWTVSSVVLVPTESDSFCSVVDVQGRVQRGAFSDSGSPTRDQVLQFMSWSAKEIEALLATAGMPYTVPSGVNPLTAGTEPQNTLIALTRQLNALKSSYTAVVTQAISMGREMPERAKQLRSEANDLSGRLVGFIEKVAHSVSGRARASSNSGSTTSTDNIVW